VVVVAAERLPAGAVVAAWLPPGAAAWQLAAAVGCPNRVAAVGCPNRVAAVAGRCSLARNLPAPALA